MIKSSKSILAVGSIALDSLETVEGNRSEILGGSSTYFGLAVNLFSSVSLVGVVGEDFPQEGWDLFANNNIDIKELMYLTDSREFLQQSKYKPTK